MNHDTTRPPPAPVIEEQRFRATLALVVARTYPDRIDVAPILFRLRMHQRIAIHLAGRGLEDAGAQPFGETKHVDRAVDAGLGVLHRITLVVDGGGGAC